MTSTTSRNVRSKESASRKRCEGFVVEGGRFRKRWIDTVTLRWPGALPLTLKGDRLPDSLVLDTGGDQQAESILEFFMDSPPRTESVRLEKPPWPTGRDALTGVMAVLIFQVLLALTDAVARAMSL